MLNNISLRNKLVTLILFCVAAASTGQIYAIARGYLSDDEGLKPGMVAQMSDQSDSAENPKVERATIDKPDQIIGVTTTLDESSVTIASADRSVYLETSGEVSAYVSDINGEVKKGDLLTISPLNGVLAKYTSSSVNGFGLAVEDASRTANETYTVHTPQGEKTTNVAKIKVNLDQKGLSGSSAEVSSLERLGRSVTGKVVSELRVVVALIIFTIVLIAEGAILYGSISSAVTSIGRNPLASETVRRELLKVILIAFMVMMVGLSSIYLVLWV